MIPWQAIQHNTDKKHTYNTYYYESLKQNTTPSFKKRWLIYLLWTSYRVHKHKNIENKIKSSLYNNTSV